MSETPKWIVEAAEEIDDSCGCSCGLGIEGKAAIIAKHSPVEQLVEALEAIVGNRELCFIPEQDTADALLHWTEKAEAALALARGEK